VLVQIFLKSQHKDRPCEHLFIAVEDFSRQLHVGILPDKTQASAAEF